MPLTILSTNYISKNLSSRKILSFIGKIEVFVELFGCEEFFPLFYVFVELFGCEERADFFPLYEFFYD